MMMTFGANRCLTIKTKKKEMKKNLFMVAAVALMALVSCNKEEINNGGVEPQEPQTPSVTVEFTASLDTEDTKTTLDFANKKTLWVETDAISINGQKFTIKEIQEDGKAIFENAAELPADFGAPFTAIYPYGSDGKVPAAQDAVAGNFDPKAVIETATSDNYSLSFKNVTSLLKFQVSASCSAVTLKSDDVLAGVDATSVTINGDFVANTDYYVAVLPGDKTNFAVEAEGVTLKSASKVSIGNSMIVNMGTLKTRVRLFVESEKTGFDMKIYAWGIDGVELPNAWPGSTLSWDDKTSKYYYDFPLAVFDKEINFIVNVNGDECKTADQKKTFANFEETYSLNWKWLYLKPNSNWKKENAKFAAYFFTKNVSGEYWQWMMTLDANYYGCVIPGDYKNVIFCRMNSSATNMNWDNKWNQTGDLTIPTDGNNLFTLPSSTWDGATTTWSKKTF